MITGIEISSVDASLKEALVQKVNAKTKPLNSLGRLEGLAIQLGLIQQSFEPALTRPSMLLFAGDHGAAKHTSAYPSEVTRQMLMNFEAGGAAINVFTRQHGLHLHVVDVGVSGSSQGMKKIEDLSIRPGSRDFTLEPALTQHETLQAIDIGRTKVKDLVKQGSNVIGLGEMGIGNTGAASLLLHLLSDLPLEQIVDVGTGLNTEGLDKKINALKKASARIKDSNAALTPIASLAETGGLEMAALVGATLEAASQKTLIIVDGFIVSVCVYLCSLLAPNVLDYCVFSHLSKEKGHALALQKMSGDVPIKPLLDLQLALGEGSGAALAFPLVQSAILFLNEMASFESAGVSKGPQDKQ